MSHIRHGISLYKQIDCLLNHSIRLTSKKTSKPATDPFVKGIHWWPVDCAHKGPVTREVFPCDAFVVEYAGCPLVNRYFTIFLWCTLKRKCLHFDEIIITGCTGSCQNDNFQCSQWWKFRQNDDIFVSVSRAPPFSKRDNILIAIILLPS